jgi:hypothetical protein
MDRLRTTDLLHHLSGNVYLTHFQAVTDLMGAARPADAAARRNGTPTHGHLCLVQGADKAADPPCR